MNEWNDIFHWAFINMSKVTITYFLSASRPIPVSDVTGLMGAAVCCDCPCVSAELQDEFSVQPRDVEVAEGELAVLNCVPPVGHPEPNVMWKKDGIPINISDHRYIVRPCMFSFRVHATTTHTRNFSFDLNFLIVLSFPYPPLPKTN